MKPWKCRVCGSDGEDHPGPAPELMSGPSPYQLWREAGGNREKYTELLIKHGYLIPKEERGEHG